MKLVGKVSAVALVIAAAGFATPASAQFYLKSHADTGKTVTWGSPGIGVPLPGATPLEQRSALVWLLRAGLNVAALQCQFEPTLQTVKNYNAILVDHADELKRSYDSLTGYFTRTAKTKRAGQDGFDHFSTQIYSSFATVNSQFDFCPVANAIGRDALFQPPGTFGDLAAERLQEMRNSLVPWGEQSFPRYAIVPELPLPRFDAACWTETGDWNDKVCGSQNWPSAATGIAAR